MGAPEIHNVQQGTEAWHALRARHFCASDAPAMMGASPYMSRAELLRRKALGIEREHDVATEMRFRNGHEAEEAYRPHAEQQLGELFPAVMTCEVDGLPLLASLDGITADGEAIWEHKAYNENGAQYVRQHGEPPMHYVWQLEHQLLVSGASGAMFTFSDGTPEKAVHCWYVSKSERRAALIAGWRQFAADLEAASKQLPPQPTPAEHVQAKPVEGFGTLVLRVEGRVLASNLDAFRAGAEAFLARLPKPADLKDDQDFADAEAAAKACAEAESRIRAAKEQAIAQMADVEAVLRTADTVAESIRQARLALEKAVRGRKDQIRAELVQQAVEQVREHYAAIARELGQYAPDVPANLSLDLAAAIKGLKTFQSVRDRLDQAVAQEKIRADALARFVRANVGIVRSAIEQHGIDLWPDAPRLCREMSEEALLGVIEARLAEHKRRQAATAAAVVSMAKEAMRPATDPQRTIMLRDINARISPLSITAEGLASLGFRPVGKERTAVLYREADFARMCDALIDILTVARRATAASNG